MPYVPHLRAVTRFELGPEGDPKEEASCTLNFMNPGLIPGVDRVDIANDMLGDWRTYVTDSASRITNAVKVTQVRLYNIDSTGHMVGDPAFSTGAPARGVVTSGHHPWQCSVVVTLVAGESGKGRFGRIYLPPMAFDVFTDGLIGAAHHGTMLTSVKTLLEALSNRPGIDAGFALAVAGRTGAEGTLRNVTKIRLGRVCDTQRRRRRSLDEAYVTTDFAG